MMSYFKARFARELELKRILPGLLLVASLLLTAFFIRNCVRALSAKWPFWFEGVVAGFMNNMRLGRLYQSEALHSEPYSVLTHTPLSYVLDYGVYSLYPGYWPLRLTNMVLVACCALLVVNLSRLENRHRGTANWFAAAVFLCCPPVFFWSSVARCSDTLACLFSLAAVTALVGLPSSLRRELAIGVFWALAVLSKQSAAVVLAPVLVIYDIFLIRNRSYIAWRFAFCGAVLLPVFGYLQWSSNGGFLHNVIGGNLVGMSAADWVIIVSTLGGFWLMCLIVVALGGLRKSATSVWFVSSFAFGLPGVAKRGADINYFFDTSAALAILAAGVAICLPQRSRPLVAGTALALGILAMVQNDRSWQAKSIGDQDYARVIAWLSSNTDGKGSVLSDDAGIPIALGQDPVMDDPFIFAEWAKLGTWSDSTLVDGLHSGKYAAVVISNSELFWSPAVRDEITSSYILVQVFRTIAPGPKCVYVPAAALAATGNRTLVPYTLTPEDRHWLPCYLPLRPR
jgi:hypothetical protein